MPLPLRAVSVAHYSHHEKLWHFCGLEKKHLLWQDLFQSPIEFLQPLTGVNPQKNLELEGKLLDENIQRNDSVVPSDYIMPFELKITGTDLQMNSL